ncbi:adenylyltransferase/cytidyltransferase family protein [Candidatus Woesearchaeota archaeon]|nr:adenylyltransferase/cytidyltransferase family protein [Candidatus Woesearchaeota archaeon]
MHRALFIGRFQPFHNAHLIDIKKVLKEADEVIIAIGSSQEKNILDNPFSYKERRQMIANTLKNNKINHYKIYPVFKRHDSKVKKIRLIRGISSTIIRDKIIKNKDWQSLVPKEIEDYIKKVNGVERIKKIYSSRL